MENYILEARNLVKNYPGGDKAALNGVSLGIAPGEFLAVVGRSGSGKSTLLNMLSALARPDSGEVLYRGADIAHAPEAARNRLRGKDFAFIFQQHHLMPYLTALENVLLPCMNSLRPLSAGQKAKGLDVLARVGLEHKAKSRPGELSGGEQQRVAIARALAREASVLFADEPTGSLDSDTGAAIMDLVRSLNQGGLTVVMVTHNREYAAQAHRAVSMKDGLLSADV